MAASARFDTSGTGRAREAPAARRVPRRRHGRCRSAAHHPVRAGWRRPPPRSRRLPSCRERWDDVPVCRPGTRRLSGQRGFGSACIVHRKVHRMHFLPTERVALFIDGANLYSASRNLGFDVDYRNLLEYFRKQAHVIRAYYYSAVLETDEYSPLKPLTDWLAYNGYTLVTKPAKEFTDASGRRRVKGSMDIEVAVDMLELSPRIDHAVLFSGDSDFRRLVEAMQRKGVRVSVVSSIRTSPPMVADELRRQADQFLELAEIAPEFTRRQTEPRVRSVPLRQTPAEPFPDPHDAA